MTVQPTACHIKLGVVSVCPSKDVACQELSHDMRCADCPAKPTLCVCCGQHPVPWYQLLCDCCQHIGEQLGLITPPDSPPRIQIGPLDV